MCLFHNSSFLLLMDAALHNSTYESGFLSALLTPFLLLLFCLHYKYGCVRKEVQDMVAYQVI